MQRTLVMIGVSGCGKSEIGQRLAAHFDCRFVEGDALHAPASIAKMAAGLALEDADREGWLLRLQAIIAQARQDNETIVVSCSALKRRYREILRAGGRRFAGLHSSAGQPGLAAGTHDGTAAFHAGGTSRKSVA